MLRCSYYSRDSSSCNKMGYCSLAPALARCQIRGILGLQGRDMRVRKFNDGCLSKNAVQSAPFFFLCVSPPLNFPAVQMPLALASSLMLVWYCTHDNAKLRRTETTYSAAAGSHLVPEFGTRASGQSVNPAPFNKGGLDASHHHHTISVIQENTYFLGISTTCNTLICKRISDAG